MYQAIRAITVIALIAIFLSACGGSSSGESTGGGSGTTATTTTVSSNNSVVQSGAAFYQQTTLGCAGCHGNNGEGNAFQAINTVSPTTCPSCTDVATLAASIAATMPNIAPGPAACGGTTEGSCAHDIAVFMMDQWFNSGSTPPTPATPGITVSAAFNPSTDESGATETITVVLNTVPTADVNIGVSSDNVNEGTVDTAMLSFNATDWNQPKSVVVTGVDDGNVDGNVAYKVLFAIAISADADYSGMTATPNEVTIVNNDNDVAIPAAINISQVNNLITDENGTSASFDVSLSTAPTLDVTINFASSDPTEGTVAPASITFNSGNYNTLQTVTVTGVDDLDLDGPINYMITTTVTSTDPVYSLINPSDVALTNNDNEVPPPAGVTVNPTMGLITAEVGAGPGPNTFTVVLQTMPTADVVIPISSGTPTEGTANPSSLTFTMVNWNTPQTVTVTGVNDVVIDGDIQYTIVTGDPASGDAGYDALTAAEVADVTVTNRDDDAFIAGKAEYDNLAVNGCSFCHGDVGQGAPMYPFIIGPVNNMCGSVDCLNEAELITYLINEMPPNGIEANCGATCASNIAKYMLNNFSVTP